MIRIGNVNKIKVSNNGPNTDYRYNGYGNGTYNWNISGNTPWYRKNTGPNSYYGIYGKTTNSDSGNGTGDWCPSNQYSWAVSNLENTVITAAQHNELKSAITLELQRRHRSATNSNNQAVSPGVQATNERVKALRNELNSAASWSYPSEMQDANLQDGDYIQAEAYHALRNRLNVMADDCVCNCNYCTCNCNYCTCNCNYACTCNCNYSDINLKEDVQYAA